jgi:hypothetical protein
MTMTKEQERNLVHETIRNLPDSYLKDILATELPAIIQAIDNDMGFLDLAGLSRLIIEEREELKRVQQQTFEARRALADVTRQHSRIEDSIREMRTTARQISNL